MTALKKINTNKVGVKSSGLILLDILIILTSCKAMKNLCNWFFDLNRKKISAEKRRVNIFFFKYNKKRINIKINYSVSSLNQALEI